MQGHLSDVYRWPFDGIIATLHSTKFSLAVTRWGATPTRSIAGVASDSVHPRATHSYLQHPIKTSWCWATGITCRLDVKLPIQLHQAIIGTRNSRPAEHQECGGACIGPTPESGHRMLHLSPDNSSTLPWLPTAVHRNVLMCEVRVTGDMGCAGLLLLLLLLVTGIVLLMMLMIMTVGVMLL